MLQNDQNCPAATQRFPGAFWRRRSTIHLLSLWWPKAPPPPSVGPSDNLPDRNRSRIYSSQSCLQTSNPIVTWLRWKRHVQESDDHTSRHAATTHCQTGCQSVPESRQCAWLALSMGWNQVASSAWTYSTIAPRSRYYSC